MFQNVFPFEYQVKLHFTVLALLTKFISRLESQFLQKLVRCTSDKGLHSSSNCTSLNKYIP